MVNGSSAVFVEREGRIERVADVQIGERNLQVAFPGIGAK